MAGYGDEVFNRRRGVRSKWRHLQFAGVRRQMAGFYDHLDIGCGPGTFISTLPDEYTSVGIDADQAEIEFAISHNKAPNREFRVAAAGDVPFADESFDVVTLIRIVERLQLDDARHVLKEVRRVLRPGGRVLVATTNFGCGWPLVDAVVGRLGQGPVRTASVTRFTRDTLGEILSTAGFARARVSGYMLAAPFAAALGWRFADWIARIEPTALRDRRGLLLLANAAPKRD